MKNININGFKRNGEWFKGNLHSHTTVSDGKLTPQESVNLYKGNGYDFMCLSEHDIYTDFRGELNSEGFIILPGIECSSVLYDEDNQRKKYIIYMDYWELQKCKKRLRVSFSNIWKF